MITYNFCFFPAAGRLNEAGNTAFRGSEARYWSSSAYSTAQSWYLYYYGAVTSLNINARTANFSIRCVAH